MSSADIRVVDFENDLSKIKVMPDPYWPPLGFRFEVSPEELNDWATHIFNASEFLFLLDGEQK